MERFVLTINQLEHLINYTKKLKEKYQNFNDDNEVIVKYRVANGIKYLVSVEGVNLTWGWLATELEINKVEFNQMTLETLFKSLSPYDNSIKY